MSLARSYSMTACCMDVLSILTACPRLQLRCGSIRRGRPLPGPPSAGTKAVCSTKSVEPRVRITGQVSYCKKRPGFARMGDEGLCAYPCK